MRPAVAGRVDDVRKATPFLRVENGYLWDYCEVELDRIATAFRQAAAKRNLTVFVRRSPLGTWPGWVSFDAWIPDRNIWTTARFRINVKLTPLPHHRREVLVETSLHDRGIDRWTTKRQLALASIKDPDMLGDAAIDQLVDYAAGTGNKRPPLFRWKPFTNLFRRNKIPNLGLSDLQKAGFGLLIFGSLPIGAISIIFLVLSFLVLGVDGLIRLTDRRVLVMDCGRPASVPRSLLFLDTWYALVRGIGREAVPCRESLLERLRSTCPEEAVIGLETVDYRVLDDLIAREQIVVRFRRAVVFCHVYGYGEDLYVGWDAHLDCGDWKEIDVSQGYSPVHGVKARLTTVQSGITLPTNYQLADANGVAEWVHRQIREHVKLLMAEHAIDQEIDFTIIRGQRDDALGRRSDSDSKNESKTQSRRFRMRRIA
ncbi:hypothetical protein [Paracoccus sp. SSK6]|uniref:hypothetical protein n=1 Tax=Paracoccus sp. SSK6 TaxID=3143131 RepID=UPI0032195C0F